MNIGQIVTRVLTRAQLDALDYKYREFATDVLNEVIQEHWNAKTWNFRCAKYLFNTSNGVEEYALNKSADIIVDNTFRGSDPVRRIIYQPKEYFFKTHPFTLDSGDPRIWRDGEMTGVQTQPSASSTISFSSSLSNISTGTAIVVKGETRVVVSSSIVTVDWLGRWFRVGTDDKRYLIVKVLNGTTFLIHEPYEQASNASASYNVGDVQQKAVVQGFLDSGAILEEEVQLNGATAASTINSFAALISISKSDKTKGSIKATSNGGVITNIILDPGELDAEYKTFFLYPIPEKEELIQYWSYGKHPFLYAENQRPLFPNKWHQLLALDTYIRIMNEFKQVDVAQDVLSRREMMLDNMYAEDNDLSNFHNVTETEERSIQAQATNLPENFGPEPYDDFI